MQRNEPNKTKQAILTHLSANSSDTAGHIAKTLGMSAHGAAMCLLRLQRQVLVRKVEKKKPCHYEVTEKGRNRLHYYQTLNANR